MARLFIILSQLTTIATYLNINSNLASERFGPQIEHFFTFTQNVMTDSGLNYPK